jgi:cystathionine beta-lyase
LALPAELSTLRSATKWPKELWLLRLQIGLEPVEQLKAELEAGFERYNRALN